MKILIRKTKDEAKKVATYSDVIIPFGSVFAVVPKNKAIVFKAMQNNQD